MLVSISDARRQVLGLCRPLLPIEVAVSAAGGLVLAEPVVAPEPLPAFTNSAMDGYALRAADVVTVPARLAEVGSLMAGDDPGPLFVGPGQAVRIMTGAPLPAGADAVCMVERTRQDDGFVWVDESVSAGTSVRPAGDDITAGQVALDAGAVLGAGQVGLLYSLGVTDVKAYPRPRVGVASTGDELVSGGGPLPNGKIRDSNRPALLAQLSEDGFTPVDLGHAADDPDELAAALLEAAGRCDAVITSGGVSVGDRDVVRMVLEELGGEQSRWLQVAVKPAKPFAFAPIGPGAMPVFGLPGNPVSSLVSYELFARPALRAMAGHGAIFRPQFSARAAGALGRAPDGKTHLMRVVVSRAGDGALEARLAGGQGSHQMRSMAAANALAVVADGDGVAEGGTVEVWLLSPDSLGAALPSLLAAI